MYVDPHLPRHTFGWYSPRLGLEMPIVAYGDRGHPLLIYPTAQADFLENERFWLIKSIEHLIFAGKVRVFSIDSINRFAWMNRDVSVPDAARRQAAYSAYVEEEVVPHIRRVMNNPRARIGVSGASFGAFHAANQLFRRPDLFDVEDAGDCSRWKMYVLLPSRMQTTLASTISLSPCDQESTM